MLLHFFTCLKWNFISLYLSFFLIPSFTITRFSFLSECSFPWIWKNVHQRIGKRLHNWVCKIESFARHKRSDTLLTFPVNEFSFQKEKKILTKRYLQKYTWIVDQPDQSRHAVEKKRRKYSIKLYIFAWSWETDSSNSMQPWLWRECCRGYSLKKET